MDELLRRINRAQYVRYIKEMGIVFAWDGAHTIRVLDFEGKGVDVLLVGDVVNGTVSLNDVTMKIDEYIESEGL